MYEIDGIPLRLLPESGNWMDRDQIGTDGQRRPVYEPTYSYRLRWSPMSVWEFEQLRAAWRSVSVTGTHTIVLPDYDAILWSEKLFSGVLFEEPSYESYWEESVLGVEVRVVNIRM